MSTVVVTRSRPAKQASKRGAKSEKKRDMTVAQTLLRKTPFTPISKMVDGMIYYDYQKVLSGGAGAVPMHVFSANGMFDPDVTSFGHQPIAFDQACALYEQFTVVKSHIKVTFASGGAHARVGVFLNPDTTNPGLPRLVENGLMKMAVVSGPSDSSGRFSFATLELEADIPKYFGRSREALIADPQMYGTIAANPGEQVYFCICAWSAFDPSADVSVAFDVTITYDALWWEPKKLSSS